jgi:hypothetical protein
MNQESPSHSSWVMSFLWTSEAIRLRAPIPLLRGLRLLLMHLLPLLCGELLRRSGPDSNVIYEESQFWD